MRASECWQLDELATCFVVFFIDFRVAKVKERTNILTSAEQYRRITGTERFYDKSDLLANIALRCCLDVTQIKGIAHDTLIIMLLVN